MRVLKGHTDSVRCVAFAPDGQSLASASYDGSVKVWDTATGCERLPFRCRHFGGVGAFLCVAFAPDGRSLAAGGDCSPDNPRPYQVVLWDWPDGRQRTQRGGIEDAVPALAFTPDSRTLAVADGAWIGFWNAADGQGLRRRIGSTQRSLPEIRALAFSPDGRTLAAGTEELYGPRGPIGRTTRRLVTGEVRLWDMAQDAELPALRGHAHAVFSLAFSPNGSALTTGSADRTVRIWDLTTRQERAILRGHNSPVHSVAFAPDGRTIASASTDGTVRLCDVVTGQLRAAFDWEIGYVNCVAFAPDGMTAAAAGANGSIVLWDLDLP